LRPEVKPAVELGGRIIVTGEITATEDLVVQCRVDGGPIWSEDGAITVAAAASVSGDIVARDITVHGTVNGTLLATEVVDIRSTATVTGRVVARRLIIDEGAHFNGSVEPQHLDAALSVARHRRVKA
jgi:cytoskeletal protein CcmA (bactofilin family)